MSALHYRTCNLCEAMCGLEIEHEAGKVVQVRGDGKDPFSKGYLCPKGARIGDIYSDPNRLRRPLRRRGSDFEEITWDSAFEHIQDRLEDIRARHGNDAVAMYYGNPSVHNLGTLMWVRGMRLALATKNLYTATSVDQLPHHVAAYYMFGDPLRLPVPDINRCDFLILMGANPWVSNGSLMSAAGVQDRLQAIGERGSWVVIDPRRTETAKHASEHLAIIPGTDAYFLLALLRTILASGARLARLADHSKGLAELRQLTEPWTPARAAALTGIDAATIERLATTLLQNRRAAIFGRMGLSTHPQGGLCQWLLLAINAITGHLDSEGGMMFPSPAIEIARDRPGKRRHNRWQSRVRGYAEFNGELPVATLADEILTPGRGQVRALISSCGNPALSTPDAGRLQKALASLDFMVSIDIYLNETSRHADIILPPATGLEVDHYDLAFHSLAISNHVKYSSALFAPQEGQLFDYQIYGQLARRLSKRASLKHRAELALLARTTPKRLVQLGLAAGAYGKLARPGRLRAGLSWQRVVDSIHGIDLGPLRPRLPDVLVTRDKKVDLAPQIFVAAVAALDDHGPSLPPLLGPGEFRLIGRRDLRSNNSWMHNSSKLMAGKERCTIQLHPLDADALGAREGQVLRVRSKVGAITLPLERSEDLARGVACIPHGFGHDQAGCDLDVARAHPGANVNELTDAMAVDPVTGNAAFSGQVISIELA